MNYKILFAGSGEFAAEILKKLASGEFRPFALLTLPNKPTGRDHFPSPTPAKKTAAEFGLEIHELKSLKTAEAAETLKSFEPDLLIVSDYGKIIPKNILEIPKFGALNVHPSLLPRYRGATPIQNTILNGDEKTGVTIILMDELVDHGPIVAFADCRLPIADLTYYDLLKKLSDLGGDLLIKTLPQWLAQKITPTPQDETQATYTKILTREDGKINWQESAEEIDRQIRALLGWPGTWCVWPDENKKIKILHAEIFNDIQSGFPGQVSLSTDGEMLVATAKGILKINELQLEGKNKITSREFLRGYPKILNAILS